MTSDAKVLAAMLARAYAAEFSETHIMSEALLHISDNEVWSTLFSLIKDNEIHRVLIEEAVEILGFDVRSFKEYAMEKIGYKKYDFSEEYIAQILNEILKWETWAQKYYSNLLNLLNLDFSELTEEVGEEAVERLNGILKELVAWETKHAKMVEELIARR